MDKKTIVMYIKKLLEKDLHLSDINLQFVDESFFKYQRINSVFNPKIYTIFIKNQWFDRADIIDIVKNIAHEMRHAYQNAMIDFPLLMPRVESKETINQWKKEFEEYINPYTNEDQYKSQLIEIDANEYSNRVVVKLKNTEKNLDYACYNNNMR
jgi:hypothetical protein